MPPCRQGARAVARSLRPLLHAVAAVLAPVLLLASLAAVWIRIEVQRPEALDRRVRSVLAEPDVRRQLSVHLARTVTQSDSRLIAAEPALRTAAEILVESRQFAEVVQVALRQGSRAVMTGTDENGTSLADIETEFVSVLNAINPSVAQRVPRGWETRVVDVRQDSPLARTVQVGAWLGSGPRRWCSAVDRPRAAIATARRPRRAWRTVGLHTMLIGMAGVAVRPLAARRLPLGDPHSGGGRRCGPPSSRPPLGGPPPPSAWPPPACSSWPPPRCPPGTPGAIVGAAGCRVRRRSWCRRSGPPGRRPAARPSRGGGDGPGRCRARRPFGRAHRNGGRRRGARRRAVGLRPGRGPEPAPRQPASGERGRRRCDRRCGGVGHGSRALRPAGRPGGRLRHRRWGQLAAALSCLGAMLWWDVAGAPAPSGRAPTLQRPHGAVVTGRSTRSPSPAATTPWPRWTPDSCSPSSG
ncbi:MAG: hypothetical protein R2749_28205 [Acidimicrobiales bacterium]